MRREVAGGRHPCPTGCFDRYADEADVGCTDILWTPGEPSVQADKARAIAEMRLSSRARGPPAAFLWPKKMFEALSEW
jgi:hypothetical protein